VDQSPAAWRALQPDEVLMDTGIHLTAGPCLCFDLVAAGVLAGQLRRHRASKPLATRADTDTDARPA